MDAKTAILWLNVAKAFLDPDNAGDVVRDQVADFAIAAIEERELIRKAWPQPWHEASDADYAAFNRAMVLWMRDNDATALRKLAGEG